MERLEEIRSKWHSVCVCNWNTVCDAHRDAEPDMFWAIDEVDRLRAELVEKERYAVVYHKEARGIIERLEAALAAKDEALRVWLEGQLPTLLDIVTDCADRRDARKELRRWVKMAPLSTPTPEEGRDA